MPGHDHHHHVVGEHDHRHAHDHGHAHSHGAGHHHEHHSHGDLRALLIVFVITSSFMVVELITGYLFNSLALTADAWHMLSDAGSLLLALFATVIARRPRSPRKTFGYQRLEVLAALGNGVVLAVAAILIVKEAWERWWAPEQVKGLEVAAVGTVGLVLNLTSAFFLHERSEGNVNVRAALAHVLGDAMGSCAAIAAGLIVYWTGYLRADPLLSVAVSALLIWSGWRIIGETAHILMEGTPEGIDPRRIEEAIMRVPGVGSVHDLHVWSIAVGQPAVTAHIVLAEGVHHGEQVARSVCDALERQFHVEHATIQPEPRPPGIVKLGTSSLVPPGAPARTS